ncbi:MAG: S9 family peptidase [bacterium]|nr:S9 family peptidase [bacterium]
MNLNKKIAQVLLILLVPAVLFAYQGGEITIDDVVKIKYVGGQQWSPDGKYVSYTVDDEGRSNIWLLPVEGGEVFKVTDTKESASAIVWMPDGQSFIYQESGDLWMSRLSPGSSEKITDTKESERLTAISPDHKTILFNREGQVWKYTFLNKKTEQLSTAGSPMRSPVFSTDGKKILYTTSRSRIRIMDLDKKLVEWEYDKQALSDPVWLKDGNRVLAQKRTRGGNGREFWVINPKTREEEKIFEEFDEFTLDSSQPMMSPTEDRFIMIRNPDGWNHIWLVDINAKTSKQLTQGEFEVSYPEWSPDGSKIIFASNRETLEERHLFVMNSNGGSLKKLTEKYPGTNIDARWSPDGSQIAFTHCGPYKVSDIWLGRPEGNMDAVQRTFSMPPVWTEDNISIPERVVYKGGLDWDITGWLFKPKNMDPNKKYPAIVWVHGGPIRQMRYGWHPRRGYSLFHSYHQRLVQLGYVVLSVNFRGGVGYGKEFMNGLHMKMGVDEVIDVINGGKYLQAQSFVDPEKVGIWGLSYGGYMTLHALGKHPGTFSMGINVAGVFNWATQVKIYNYRGRFVRFFGGHPDKSPEPYRIGSPITYVQNIDVPLLNLQGTADRNVPFSQMDEIVECMVKYNLDFDVMYYPGQLHVFQDGDVWRNAFPKIEKFFEMHLKKPGDR